MPIEIKELVIRAVVEKAGQSSTAPAGGADQMPVDRQAIVEESVRQVLQVLRAAEER